MFPQWRVVGAVLRKDLRCLYPVVLLALAVFAGDVPVMRLDLWPLWESVRQPLVLLSSALLVFAVFQLDSPVSLVDDWLCRPVPRRELLIAKGGLILATIYGSRVLATLILDIAQHRPAAETFADAFLLQDEFFVLVLALLWMIGVTTRTTVQAIGALIAVFVAVFVIPTAFTPSPRPLRADVGESLLVNGMSWLVGSPAKLLAVAGPIVCCWLVYSLRRTGAARVWIGACVVAGLAVFLVPMYHVPWSTLAAAQASVMPAPPDRLSLISRRDCLPATRLASVGDGAFGALRQAARLPWWADSELHGAGPESIAFVTSVQPRGLPRGWRAQLVYARAEYLRVEGGRPVELRPTRYETSGAGAFTHAWLLPDSTPATLRRAAAPAATFRYDFALLQPLKQSLALDDRRHRVDGIGYCGARRVPSNHAIEVDCLVTDPRVAQVSAQLPSIDPSAAFDRPDYSPAWLRALLAQRVHLTVTSARLSTEDRVEVIAWRSAGLVERTWSGETCALPDSSGAERLQASRWRDSAPHETQLIAVDSGVSLEVLDFGGQGSPLLLVPGLGATAHSFDTLAPRLAEHHRVYAMTRRGTGASSRVDFGYDTPRLARDIIAVLDALGLPKVTLIGHSIAGDELTWLGGHNADRLTGLVYLDAAYDRSVRNEDSTLQDLELLLPPEPPVREQDMVDYASFTALQVFRQGPPLPEGELIAFYQAGKPFLAGLPDIDPRVAAAVPAALKRPDYRSLKVPALALYAALDDTAPIKPWYDPNDPEQMRVLREIGVLTQRARQGSIDQLRAEAPGATIVELKGAKHWIFLSNEQDVLDAIERFIRINVGTRG